MTALRLLGAIAIGFNAINMFATAEGSVMAYITLSCAVLGIGGSYASLYVVIAESVPTAQLGGVMVFAFGIAVLSTTAAPLVVLLD